MSCYSLSKCRRILRHGFKLLQKKGTVLTISDRASFEKDLRALDAALLKKNKEEAVLLAKKVESTIKTHFPKTLLDYIWELFFALLFALVVAYAIRQLWFELYEVPTGSMRPTVKELDRMVVSKTTFGVALPFKMKPLFYSDDYLRRQGTIVFTVQGMDMVDTKMRYFLIFPGYKRFVKRCMTKPGDTIYFYGGRIYGIDKQDQPIKELSDESYLKRIGIERIEHIPFITFDGKMLTTRNSVTLKQMNLPVGKFELNEDDEPVGRFFNGEEWVEDRPDALKTPHDHPMSYSDLWGIGNFAMVRLLTKEQAIDFHRDIPRDDEAILYLELNHTPNLTYPKPHRRHDEFGRLHPMIAPMVTLLPLNRDHLNTIQKALFTARFVVKNGRASRYQKNGDEQPRELDPKFPNVPNGCYEIYYGQGYKVHFGGIQTKLPPNHPLYNHSPENIQKLFNLGISFNCVFSPLAPLQPYNPQRFAYFRDGDLFIMGAPIFKKDDPTLTRFIEREKERERESSREEPYIAFVDRGSPVKDGKLDIEFIKSFGLKVPEGWVVGLGDNYAMSADSRDFGFIPTDNLRGAPSFIFWPPGNRLGILPQPHYPWLTFPNLLIWSLATLVIIGSIVWIIRRNSRSVFDKNR